jgi:Helicase conserved C-terminal domain
MNTFRQELVACTDQQLEQIFHLWGMGGLPNSDLQERKNILLQRVKDPIAAHFVWEYLHPDEREVLYRILGHQARNGTRRDLTQKKSQLTPERFEEVIVQLKYYTLLKENAVQVRVEPIVFSTFRGKTVSSQAATALLYPYTESVDALYTAGKEFFSANSDRSAMTFDKLLSSFNHGELNTILPHYIPHAMDYYAHGYTQAETRAMIEDELAQANGAFEILQKLGPPVRDLCKWLCEQGGKVSMQRVREHTGYDDTALLKALHQLEEYAIAFQTFSGREWVLFVPTATFASVRKATQQTAPEVIQVGLMPLPIPPEAVYEAATPMLYDMAIIIGAIHQQNIEPTQAGKVPKRLASKIQPLLHGLPRIRYMNEEDEYMDMVFHIAQELGIARLFKPTFEGVKAHFEPGPQLERWSHLDMVGQIRLLLQCWLKSFNWLDVRGVNFRQWDPFYWNPMAARGSILEQLQKCKPGQWYSIASLLEVIWDKNPFELRPVQYNIRPAERRKSSAMRIKWNSCEGEVYLGILASTLYELGVVAVGNRQPPDREDGPVNPDAFMLTELGASVLSSIEGKATSQPSVNGKRSLVLQPNFELLLLEPDMPTLYSLLPFTQVNQVDMVSRLTLTRASALRGVEAGKDIEQMLEILAERSQKEVPQNVAYTMRDWVKSYKDVKISQVLLLEVSSEAVADQACSSAKLQPFNLRRLGPCTLIVSSDINLQELRRIFEKEGILVRFRGEILTRQHRQTISFDMPR